MSQLPSRHDLEDHVLRSRVLAEIHARPFVPLGTPRRLLHYAFITDIEAATADRAAIAALSASVGVDGPSAQAKHHRVGLPDAFLRWEAHSEFTTYTWEFSDEARNEPNRPFRPSPSTLADVMRLVPQPGPLLVAVDLHLLPAGTLFENLGNLFNPGQVAAAEVEDGSALIATDFSPGSTGSNSFIRVLIANRDLSDTQAGALVQRVLEIETYRTLALLGLPEAQALGPSIQRIETELPLLIREMQRSEGFDANRRLLERLTGLAAELEAGAAGSLFRLGATRAYDELVRLRLDAIRERPLPSVPSWSSFLSRRMAPAIRTCISTEERQANLSRKLARAAQLLRTRVDIELESQNSDLLRTMNDRAQLQLRLQRTVEGLSVAAITYYVASLAHIIFDGAHEAGLPVNVTVATAVVVPFALLGVGWTVRRIRKRHVDPH